MSRLLFSFFVAINFLLPVAYANSSGLEELAQEIFAQHKEYAKGFPLGNGHAVQYPGGIGACIAGEEFYGKIRDLRDLLTSCLNESNIPISAEVSHLQKVTIEKDSKIIPVGDIHGSVHSLLRNLLRFLVDGILDDNFKLADGYYLVFTGDYADRGRYGVEVWYLLARLKLANPERVFLIRGNHEDISQAGTYGFVVEMMRKYGVMGDDIKEVVSLFNYLPVALLIGRGENYVMACHGGLPVKESKEEEVETCVVYDKELGMYVTREKVLCGNTNPFAMCTETKSFVQEKHPGTIAFMPINSSNTIYQFLWNDFIADKDIWNSTDRGKGLYDIGIGVMQDAFDAYGVQAILRGHGHNENAISMYECKKESIVFFQDGSSTTKTSGWKFSPLPHTETCAINNKVCVFMSAPEVIESNVDGYGVLRLVDDEWELCAHEYELPEERDGKRVSYIKDDGSIDFLWLEDNMMPWWVIQD